VASAPRTRIGGIPDLPEGLDWPRHHGKSLAFISQVNLEEIPRTSFDSPFPATGVLYFFYDSEQSTWGFDPKDKGSWRVLYSANVPDVSTEAQYPEDVPEHARYEPRPLEVTVGKSIPEPMEMVMSSGLPEDKQDLVLDLYGRYSEYGLPKHQLLGYPMPGQGDMQLECQLVSHGLYCGDETGYNDPRAKELEAGARDWQVLLQVDTHEDAGMMWGDCGRLYFWIRKDDLINRNFDATWMILQCS
jgi:uncharacterized protein YwqG